MMGLINKNMSWEDHFSKEYFKLEDEMSGYDIIALSKSKLRLAIENGILDWDRYENWAFKNYQCPSLKRNTEEEILKRLKTDVKQTYNSYSDFDFWSEDLIPVLNWENKLYVLGLQYNENLEQIKNHIFILTPPEILNCFSKIIFNDENDIENLSLENEIDDNSESESQIEGLNLDVKAPNLDFTSIISNKSKDIDMSNRLVKTSEEIELELWDFIKERHKEYSFEVKKSFNAYIVLRIVDNQTKVFKMDEDLVKEEINENLFSYNVTQDNPFNRVFNNGTSESFSLSQLGLNLKSFNYACITALKRNDKVVGFLVGFKNENLSENDQILLEDLAKESAAA